MKILIYTHYKSLFHTLTLSHSHILLLTSSIFKSILDPSLSLSRSFSLPHSICLTHLVSIISFSLTLPTHSRLFYPLAISVPFYLIQSFSFSPYLPLSLNLSTLTLFTTSTDSIPPTIYF